MATPVVPNQFAVGKNQIIHKDSGRRFFMQGLMGAPTPAGAGQVSLRAVSQGYRESTDLLTANLIVHHVKNW